MITYRISVYKPQGMGRYILKVDFELIAHQVNGLLQFKRFIHCSPDEAPIVSLSVFSCFDAQRQ